MKNNRLVLFFIFIICLIFSGCSKTQALSKNVQKNSLIYASYSNGDYSLYFVNLDDFKTESKINLYKGWGGMIYKDNEGRIWSPITYKPDMTTAGDVVIIFDTKNQKMTSVKVGGFPEYVFFKDKMAYVVCSEDGTSPTIYSINSSFTSEKLFTMKDAGLLSGADFDGNNFYFNSVYTNSDHTQIFPKVIKQPLHGEIQEKQIDTELHGVNALLSLNNVLYMGLQTKDSSFISFEPTTLEKKNSFPYNEMVGEIIKLDDNTVAITNFSSKMLQGSKITIMDINNKKVLKTFNAKYTVEHLTYLNNKYYAVDNKYGKLEIFDNNGKTEKIVNIPTQVNKILPYQ